jgi:hypothetical protein
MNCLQRVSNSVQTEDSFKIQDRRDTARNTTPKLKLVVRCTAVCGNALSRESPLGRMQLKQSFWSDDHTPLPANTPWRTFILLLSQVLHKHVVSYTCIQPLSSSCCCSATALTSKLQKRALLRSEMTMSKIAYSLADAVRARASLHVSTPVQQKLQAACFTMVHRQLH